MNHTEPLDEYLERFQLDENVFWATDTGDLLNLFTEAVQRMQRAEAKITAAQQILEAER